MGILLFICSHFGQLVIPSGITEPHLLQFIIYASILFKYNKKYSFSQRVITYKTLSEPNALSVEKNGFGHVVAYIGELGGTVPYTAYNARKSYIENNPEIIKSFSRAINKGLEFVKNNDAPTIAKSILKFFPDTSLTDLTKIVDRYKAGDAWKDNININVDEWNHIQEIMTAAGELDKHVDYDKLIYSEYFNE